MGCCVQKSHRRRFNAGGMRRRDQFSNSRQRLQQRRAYGAAVRGARKVNRTCGFQLGRTVQRTEARTGTFSSRVAAIRTSIPAGGRDDRDWLREDL